jgi:predicted dehydrogenase
MMVKKFNMPRKSLKIALIGCGAVTEHRHLPALARRDDCEVVALVDRDDGRARRLSTQFRFPRCPRILTDYRELPNCDVDAAIIALPNHLHAPASIGLLKAGIHVLVEKPMALSAAECDRMIQAAEAGHAVLAVGLVRRFLYASQFTKWAIESGLLGRILSVHVQDGFIFNWPLASDFFFHRELAGGGVLMDAGVHTLDQLLWWLGDINSFEYYDDSCGGIEAECELHVTLESGAKGVVELSRTRNLRNTALIRGERAELEVELWRNSLSLRFRGSPVQVTGQGAPWERSATAEQSQVDLVAAEHDDLLEAIRAGRAPAVSGTEARRSIALIEACYREQRQLQLPWTVMQSPLLEVAVR